MDTTTKHRFRLRQGTHVEPVWGEDGKMLYTEDSNGGKTPREKVYRSARLGGPDVIETPTNLLEKFGIEKFEPLDTHPAASWTPEEAKTHGFVPVSEIEQLRVKLAALEAQQATAASTVDRPVFEPGFTETPAIGGHDSASDPTTPPRFQPVKKGK